MKIEEAIIYIKNLREYMKMISKESEYGFIEENYIALDIAIKVLENEDAVKKMFESGLLKDCEMCKAIQEPCEDAVSRQAVLNTLDNMDKALNEDRTVETYKALLKECYEVLPSVAPTRNEEELRRALYDKVGADVLDEIRAEIVKKHLSIVEKNDFDSGRTYGYEEVLDIIDKYKAEMESEE